MALSDNAACFLGNNQFLPRTDGEDEETCGFCIFMKAGGCKPEFQVNGMLIAASTCAKTEFVL